LTAEKFRLQPFGLVHAGNSATLIEIGAAPLPDDFARTWANPAAVNTLESRAGCASRRRLRRILAAYGAGAQEQEWVMPLHLRVLSLIARYAALAGRVACVPMLLAVMGSSAFGQTTGATFESLLGKVQPGDLVYLTDMNGKEQQATIRSLASALMQVEIAGTSRELQAGDVRRIRVTRRDSLWNGVAIGAGIGASLGLFSSTVGECAPSPGCVVSGTLGLAGMAAVVGWLIDQSVQKRVVVYDAQHTKNQPR
jgi:hypothetical protein